MAVLAEMKVPSMSKSELSGIEPMRSAVMAANNIWTMEE